MTEQTTIVANTNPLIELRDFTFRFKKDKIGNKRANVELKLPVPSPEGLAEILTTGGKGLELLQDIVADFVKSQASDFVSDNESISQDTFPFDKIDFQYIANLPKEDRRSAAIPAEQWEAFGKDYMAVMPTLTGKSTEAVGTALEIYVKKMAPVKSNKKVLAKLKEQLSIYSETPNAEQFEDVLTLLVRRADAYLAAGEVVYTADMI